MGIIKKILVSLLLILICLALGVTGAFLLVDNTLLIGQVVKQIESATGTRVSYKDGGVITRTLSPMITINDLKIETPDARLKVYTRLFQLQVSLPELLTGTLEIPKLVLGKTLVEIGQRNGDAQTMPVQSFFLKPVLRDVRISQISIRGPSEKYSLAVKDIRQLTIKAAPETGQLICNLNTRIGDESIDVVTTLPSVQHMLNQQQLPFSLSVVHPSLNLSSNGLIALQSSPPTIAATVQAKMTDPVNFFPLPENPALSGDVSAAAHISGTFERLNIRKCSLNVKTVNDLDMDISGQLDLVYKNSNLQTENVDLKLDVTCPNTYLAQTYLFDSIPKSGTIQGQARIHSTKGDPSLEHIVVKTLDSKDIKFDLTGRIANILTLSGFDLGVDIRLEKPNWLAGGLPESLDPVRHLRFSTQISGSYKNTRIHECRLNLKTVNDLDLNITGRFDLACDDTVLQMENTNLKVNFTGPTTRSAKVFFFDAVPEFGRIQGQTEIRSTRGAPSLEHIVVQIQDVQGLQVDLRGRINRFPLDPDVSVTGYDLDVHMKSSKMAVMAERIGIDPPISGPLDVNYKIKGDTRSLRLENIRLSAGEKSGIRVNTSGRILFGPWDQTNPVEFIDLAIGLKSQTTSLLGEAMGRHLPEFGRVTAQARLHTVSTHLRLDDIQVNIIDKMPLEITMNGAAGKVSFFPRPVVGDIRLGVTASGETPAVLADLFSLQLPAPATGRFKASANIVENKGKIGITDLSFATRLAGKDQQPLALAITGKMDDVTNSQTLSLTARGTAENLQIIGGLLAQKWPQVGPVNINSSIVIKNKGVDVDTRLTAGKTRIDAATHIMLRNGIPGISGSVIAQNLFLPDLFGQKDKPAVNTPKDKPPFFSRASIGLGGFKKVNLDLLVDIASFDRDNLNIESTRFHIHLDSGRLDIESGRVVFPKGEVLFDAHLDLEQDLNLRVKASGKEIDPWQTLSAGQTRLSKSFNADMDIDIDIATYGSNEYELFSNMNGDVYVILKNGKIRKKLIDMLFTDFIGWTVDKATGNEKYVNINCGVMDYRIKKGTIITDAFFLDARSMTVVGDGTIDLAKEQIAYVFLPKKKSRLILKAEPVRVNGPLSNPRVTVIPWKSAIYNYGTLFFGPYVFVGVKVFDFLADALRKESEISPCLKYERTHDQNIKPPANQHLNP